MFSALFILRGRRPGALCLKMHAGHEIAPDQTVSPLHSNFKATCQIQVNYSSIQFTCIFLRLSEVSKSTFENA